MREPWVSVEDVAKPLAAVKDAIYRCVTNCGLPAHRIGRLWKYSLTELDAWVRVGNADRDDDGVSGGNR